MAKVLGGYQPDTKAPSSRRADFDLQRRVAVLEAWMAAGGGGPGPGAGGSFVYNQATPATTWTINHFMGFKPNVTVEDSGGATVEGEISWPDDNTVILTFSAAFAGVAYLS